MSRLDKVLGVALFAVGVMIGLVMGLCDWRR